MAEEDVRSRIQQLLKDRKMSLNKLSSITGIGYSTLNYQIASDTKISITTLLAILDVFPDVSADWLMRGHGIMAHADIINNAHTHIGNASAGCQTAGDQSALLAEKDKRIAELTKDKENLMALLTNITSK